MIAALATLAFLIAGWAALTAVIMTSDDSGAKMLAALKGNSLASRPLMVRPVTVRFSQRYPASRQAPLRATAEWRAAA